MPLLPNYNPNENEAKIYQDWQQKNIGSPEIQETIQGATIGVYTNLMPPPNLTGDLHAGHAFGHYLMDTLTRIHRQKSEKSLWLPGVDHAGIQLEGVMDKVIKAGEFDTELDSIVDLPTNKDDWPKFLKKNYKEVWLKLAWQKANEWRGNQAKQSSVLGDTPDHGRNLFTLDEQAVNTVNFAFKKYYEDGLIYKKNYLINWSVGLQTALSDVPEDIGYEKRKDPFVTFEYHSCNVGRWQNGENWELITKLADKIESFFNKNPVRVSTVRPETIFGDVAVAIHPDTFNKLLLVNNFNNIELEKILYLIKKNCLDINFTNPIMSGGDFIKLILAEEVDQNFGTGALKITPAHDLTDYNIFHKYLSKGWFYQAVGRDGKLTEICGESAGLTVEEGRKKTIYKLIKNNYVPIKKEFAVDTKLDDYIANYLGVDKDETIGWSKYEIDWNYEHNVTICERSKTVVEPLISEEFFLSYSNKDSKGKSLQEYGLEGIQETNYYPESFQKLGLDYVKNLKDWCISRDLIWGHKMPIWYNLELNPEKKFYGAKELCKFHYIKINKENFSEIVGKYTIMYEEISYAGNLRSLNTFLNVLGEINIQGNNLMLIQSSKPTTPGNWVQEEKILDTWFSSCLWPLSTLNYLDHIAGKVTDFDTYYPTQDMVTAREIFYAWIVRMTVIGKYFTGKIPFENVVITPTIQDEQGKKMSKSLKNGLEPVHAISNFSSDSLRMAMLGGMIPNRNMRLGGNLADKLMEKYRNFGNKVWNIARFLESKEAQKKQFNHPNSASVWIMHKFVVLQGELEKNLLTYEFTHSINAIYSFLWNDFADWYVEYLKTDETQLAFAYKLFRQFIITLSPYLPFETQVLWQDYFQQKNLIVFEKLDLNWYTKFSSEGNSDEFQNIIEFIQEVRSIKGLYAIDPVTIINIFVDNGTFWDYENFIKLTARASIHFQKELNGQFVNSKIGYAVNILDYIKDKEFELNRTKKLVDGLKKQVFQLEAQLSNQKFIDNAELEAILQKKKDLEERNFELTAQENKLKIL